MKYIPIIGMEIHVEPKTKSKMFCECDAEHFQVTPNTHTCPVCIGLPGALPIPNQAAIDACIKLGLALGCRINQFSKFDRKNYFYPDLPKSYQISQYDLPFCYQGSFTFPEPIAKPPQSTVQAMNVGITRVHMEEDTGKLIHETLNGEKVSLIDYNRSGVPLIEIVTEPDLHSAADAKQFLKWLTRTIQFLGISDCDMEKGSMRLEANISVAQVDDSSPWKGEARRGSSEVLNNIPAQIPLPNYKVEVKNVNSFRYIEKAIEFEIERHIELLSKGETPKQETRGYNENRGETFSQRSKETAQDYRYFPDPDIPPVTVSNMQLSDLQSQAAASPVHAFNSLTTDHKVRADYAELLSDSNEVYQAFSQLLDRLPSQFSPDDLAKFIVNAKLNIAEVPADEILKQLQASVKTYSMDESKISEIVSSVLSSNPNVVADYKGGKPSAIGFLIGQAMKQTAGQADPQVVRKVLQEKLDSEN